MANVTDLQAKLDELSEKGKISEGAYLELCDVSKKMKEKEGKMTRAFKIDFFADIVIENIGAVTTFVDGVNMYDNAVRAAVFAKAKESRSVCCHWWHGMIELSIMMLADMAPDSEFLECERDYFLDVVKNMPKTLEMQKQVVLELEKREFQFFQTFFVDPDGDYASSDEDSEIEEMNATEIRDFATDVIEACPYMLVLFAQQNELSFQINKRVLRALAREHASEDVLADSKFKKLVQRKPKRKREAAEEAAGEAAKE